MDILIKLTMKESQRYDIIQRLIAKQLNTDQARKLLGLKSKRQVRRIKAAVKEKGLKGVIHKNRGRPSNRKFSDEFTQRIIQIYQEKYHDFKPSFATEKLLENHQIKISHEALRAILINAKLWKPKLRKQPKKRHLWRARKPNYGEMQQFDGSYHKWFEDRREECCLLLSVDDATGKITKAKFDHNEGVAAVFKFWQSYIKKNGIPLSIYLDKFSTYKVNHKNATDNKNLITQFERAANQIGMKLITAHSPEAKGRVERMNSTLQDRLTKELRLNNISTIKEANEFLEKEFIPKFNQQFAVAPQEQANLHKPLSKQLKTKLDQIFSIQHPRKVMNDYTIMFKNQYFQLAAKQPTTVYKKDTIIIEEHLDKQIKINLKGHYLNYTVLPERPKKIKDIPLCALTRNNPPWIPPKDHPWRKFTISHKQALKQNQNQNHKCAAVTKT